MKVSGHKYEKIIFIFSTRQHSLLLAFFYFTILCYNFLFQIILYFRTLFILIFYSTILKDHSSNSIICYLLYCKCLLSSRFYNTFVISLFALQMYCLLWSSISISFKSKIFFRSSIDTPFMHIYIYYINWGIWHIPVCIDHFDALSIRWRQYRDKEKKEGKIGTKRYEIRFSRAEIFSYFVLFFLWSSKLYIYIAIYRYIYIRIAKGHWCIFH